MQEVGLGTMNPIVSPITSPEKAPALSDFEVETAARDLELEMEKMDQSANDQAVPTDVRHVMIAHEVLETPASEDNVIILGGTQMEELEIPPSQVDGFAEIQFEILTEVEEGTSLLEGVSTKEEAVVEVGSSEMDSSLLLDKISGMMQPEGKVLTGVEEGTSPQINRLLWKLCQVKWIVFWCGMEALVRYSQRGRSLAMSRAVRFPG